MARHIFGLSAAMVTPFAADGTVDLPRLVKHAHWALANGTDSVTLFGTTGEGFSIGFRERAAMLGALAGNGIDFGQKLYATVGASVVADAVDQARLALGMGARGLLFTPPYYLKALDEDGLFAWFSNAFDAIGGDLRGVILYHIPGQTAVPLSVALVDRLRKAFPGVIAGIKDSSGDWDTANAYLDAHGDLAILVGDERLLPRAMARGAQGSICGLANIEPALLRSVIHDGADDPRLKAAVDLIVSHPVMPAVKAMVAHRHGDSGYARTRPPLVDLAPEQAKSLIARFDDIVAKEPVG
ncbi:dihydrodipicolinate synthase family protein [Acuticoccus sp. MNP-M23]|uniref:dihydrodipicolinate synthase family protein n=1 Tax=Acuticoccus sp. MNP-M23 TaxID=3072793 RepID=UPI0028162013|nr:dihydrodipicolinate synthase family protein [Acuticoccus sp. MNP-M23]WMS43932.1 dihydrodipicolinate synthase family protein [Acuticoccus sp. MNP-M23]